MAEPSGSEQVLAEDPEAASPAGSTAPSLLDFPATYFLIAVNLIVYLLMVRVGPPLHVLEPAQATVSFWQTVTTRMAHLLSEPFSEPLLIAYGSCVPSRVLQDNEWWRLVTSTFVHVTLLHLLLNMWCLWNLGIFGERLLGKPGLVAVYVLTGTAGMLQSVLLSAFSGDPQEIVAGASGAVFGLAGILIVLLSNRRLAAPWGELRSLRVQVIIFSLANLVLGSLPGWLPRLAPGLVRSMHLSPDDLPRIDNSAHLGGLVSGLLLGALLFPRMTSGRSTYRARQALVFGSAGLLLALVSYAAMVFEHSH